MFDLDQLSRVRPILTHIGIFIVGLILGALAGRGGVQIVDTGLWQLGTSYQAIYVQSVADAYAFDNNEAVAIDRLSYLCQAEDANQLQAAFTEAESRAQGAPERLENLNELRALSDQVQQNPEVAVCSLRPANSSVVGRVLPIALALLIIVGLAGYGIYLVIGMGEQEAAAEKKLDDQPVSKRAAAAQGTTTGAQSRAAPGIPIPGVGGRGAAAEAPSGKESAASIGASISQQAEKTDFEAKGLKPPVVQFMTTYLHGDDLYDDSFSIETPSGEFLGETGVGISETISGGNGNKQVTAFEVWLFDKNDIRTVTKVIMSDHAFNDATIRDKLKAKGEPVKAEPGKNVILETATLRIQARIVDMSYGSGPVPPNSRFDRITLELAAWKREDVS